METQVITFNSKSPFAAGTKALAAPEQENGKVMVIVQWKKETDEAIQSLTMTLNAVDLRAISNFDPTEETIERASRHSYIAEVYAMYIGLQNGVNHKMQKALENAGLIERDAEGALVITEFGKKAAVAYGTRVIQRSVEFLDGVRGKEKQVDALLQALDMLEKQKISRSKDSFSMCNHFYSAWFDGAVSPQTLNALVKRGLMSYGYSYQFTIMGYIVANALKGEK